MKLNKKSLFDGLIIFLFIFMLVSFSRLVGVKMGFLFRTFVRQQVYNQADTIAKTLSLEFKTGIDELESLAMYLHMHKERQDLFFNYVYTQRKIPEKNLGLYLLDGTCLYGKTLSSTEHLSIRSALHGISDVSFSSTYGLVFAVPIYSDENNERIYGVLYRVVPLDSLKNYFDLNFYDGQTKTAIMVRDTEELVYSDAGDFTYNILNDPRVRHSISEMRRQMDFDRRAAALTIFRGEKSCVYVAEIHGTNFMVAGILPYAVAGRGIDSIRRLFVPLCLLIFIFFVATLFFIKNEEKQTIALTQLEKEKIIAEESNRAKSDFLANMSHEIRTPINSILGMNEMILRESDDYTIRSYAGDISSAGQNLLAIINDILDFSKIEAGKMELVSTDYELCSLLNDVQNIMSIKAKKKNLDLIFDIDTSLPARMYGDFTRIEQIMVNLLNNAVKYTQEGFVRLSITQKFWQQDSVELKIEVTDSGIGIKEEDLDKLFKSFQRLDINKNRNIEGTGLGLAITQSLVTKMGGSISVKSKYGSGSTFTVILPQKTQDITPIGNFKEHMEYYRANTAVQQAQFTAPDAKILIVDDNAMNLHVAKSLLKQTLIKVSLCSSGKECLEKVKQEHFDIIFLDHMMPEMDGIETLKQLKTLEGNLCKETPVIALTANAIIGVKEMYLSEGFDDYLSKPIETKFFETMIKKYLPKEKIITKVILPNADNEPTYKIKESEPENTKENSNAQETSQEKAKETAQKTSNAQESAAQDKNADETEENNTQLDKISVERGLVYCGNDMETYKEIVSVYVDESGENMQKLEDFFTKSDWTNYTITSHAVKSTSLTIGAVEFSEMAKKQEFAGKENRIEDLKSAHSNFIETYKKVVENAKKLVS